MENNSMDDKTAESVNNAPVTDAELQVFCDDIVACLIFFGGLEEHAARALLETSGICALDELATMDNEDRLMMMHEIPYYWAMSLLHARKDPQWFNNIPGLWPPPKMYLDPDWRDRVLRRRATPDP
jgi:hypothetical protein